jgi:TPR repeat protein
MDSTSADEGEHMSRKPESPLSRRSVMKSLLAAPLALQALRAQAQGGQANSACCQGNFNPDDLFAAKSINGDLQRAQRGDLTATIRMGFAYYTGMAGRVDIPRARSYFLVASHAAPAAAAWLGYLDAAAHVKPGAAVRTWKSFQGLVSASAGGDPVAMTLLGRVYERGLAGYKPRQDKALPLHIGRPQLCLGQDLLGQVAAAIRR